MPFQFPTDKKKLITASIINTTKQNIVLGFCCFHRMRLNNAAYIVHTYVKWCTYILHKNSNYLRYELAPTWRFLLSLP